MPAQVHQADQGTLVRREFAAAVTLAMLARAFLAVVRSDEHARSPTLDGLIPLTCNESRRLFITLVVRPALDAVHRLGRSDWRRRHQARSRVGHYRRRAVQA
ncbi:hypothetical protein [Streptomyces sp. NL15-2K]|uniref:hypothetical protein n=1 Tax=Streptomyces sp. NL15-2K TaxID=376149 RepID=UPI000FFA86AB|nr:transposase [Streptomyces sp. NL15-2K]